MSRLCGPHLTVLLAPRDSGMSPSSRHLRAYGEAERRCWRHLDMRRPPPPSHRRAFSGARRYPASGRAPHVSPALPRVPAMISVVDTTLFRQDCQGSTEVTVKLPTLAAPSLPSDQLEVRNFVTKATYEAGPARPLWFWEPRPKSPRPSGPRLSFIFGFYKFYHLPPPIPPFFFTITQIMSDNEESLENSAKEERETAHNPTNQR